MTQMLMPTCVQKLNAFDSGKPVENLLIRGLTHNLRCLLGKGGVAAPIKKKRRSLLSGRRRGGSFQPPIIGSGTNHPVRAFQRNGAIYLMARPPLLCQAGEFHSDASRHFRFIVFSSTPLFCLPRSGVLSLKGPKTCR